MRIDDKVRCEKLQHVIDREAAKMSALSSEKNDKCEYLTGEEILLLDQRRVIEQAKITYSPLGKDFKKTNKKIEDQEKKHIETTQNCEKQLIKSNTIVQKMIMILDINWF